MCKITELIAPYFTPGARYELTAPVENPCADGRRKGRSPLICGSVLPVGLRFAVTEHGLRDGHDDLLFADMRRHGFIEALGKVSIQVPLTDEEEFEELIKKAGSPFYAGLALYRAALRLGVGKDALWREFEKG